MTNLEMQIFALIIVRGLSLLDAIKCVADFHSKSGLEIIRLLSDSFIRENYK